MPGPAAVSIQLDAAQRAELEQVVRSQTTSKRLYVRARVVLLAADGWTNAAISRKLDFHRASVVLWRLRFAREGIDGLSDRPRSGRPRSFSP